MTRLGGHWAGSRRVGLFPGHAAVQARGNAAPGPPGDPDARRRGFVFSQVHNVMADVPSGNRCHGRNLRLRAAGFMLN